MKDTARTGLIALAVVLALAAPVGLTAFLTRDDDRSGTTPPAPSTPTYGDGRSPEAHDLRLAGIRVPDAAGAPGTVSFEVLDRVGRPVTTMVRDATKLMHLYLVRSDMTGYQHLYPRYDKGTWSTSATLPAAGTYRVIAEFTIDAGDHNDHVILGGEVEVGGDDGAVEAAGPSDGTLTVAVEGADRAIAARSIGLRFTGSGGPVKLGSFLGEPVHVVGFDGFMGAMVRLGPAGAPVAGEDSTLVNVRAGLRLRGPYVFFVETRVKGEPRLLRVVANVQ